MHLPRTHRFNSFSWIFRLQKISAGKFIRFFLSFLLYLHAHDEFCYFFLFPPRLLTFSSRHRLSRKNIFHPREHAISESSSLHDDVEVFFCFRSLPKCWRIINGRKLRILCNIFIKFFAVACNFYEMEKFACCVMLRMERRRMEIKIKKFLLHGEGEKVYEA
jgi:hypothetical protein